MVDHTWKKTAAYAILAVFGSLFALMGIGLSIGAYYTYQVANVTASQFYEVSLILMILAVVIWFI